MLGSPGRRTQEDETAPLLRQLFQQLTAEPTRTLAYRTGISRLPGSVEWLMARTVAMAGADEQASPRLLVVGAEHATWLAARLNRQQEWVSQAAPTALLALGVGFALGHLTAACGTVCTDGSP